MNKITKSFKIQRGSEGVRPLIIDMDKKNLVSQATYILHCGLQNRTQIHLQQKA
jgi:hypothetical protein